LVECKKKEKKRNKERPEMHLEKNYNNRVKKETKTGEKDWLVFPRAKGMRRERPQGKQRKKF